MTAATGLTLTHPIWCSRLNCTEPVGPLASVRHTGRPTVFTVGRNELRIEAYRYDCTSVDGTQERGPREVRLTITDVESTWPDGCEITADAQFERADIAMLTRFLEQHLSESEQDIEVPQ